jgi:hypothetical protein
MVTRKMMFEMVEKMGGKVNLNVDSRDVLDFGIEAPPGKMFAGSDIHESIFEAGKNCTFPTREEAYATAYIEVQQGFEDCSNGPECDWCHGGLREELHGMVETFRTLTETGAN